MRASAARISERKNHIMHPVLFKLPLINFPIHSYGLMLALSFLLGIWVASVRAKRRALDPNVIMDVGFYVIIAAIIGARLYYVFLHFDEFQSNLLDIINPFQAGSVGIGGLVMYGGFIGAMAASVIYFRVKKLPFWPYADAAAPSFALGEFLTRIGCFLNGCCYGAPTHSCFGVVFPLSSPAGMYEAHAAEALRQTGAAAGPLPLHPSQLYLSAGALAIALFVIFIGRKKFTQGLEFNLTVLLMAVLRFFVDFTRYYGANERLGGLSHNQIVCLIIVLICGGLMLKPILGKDAPSFPGTPSAPAD
jgi:phosphatidylglycerol:prolipoprotein diacylglycerol transferase